MANSSVLILLILSIFLLSHCVVKLEASHHVYEDLMNYQPTISNASQPYRTGYHFQPPKNWMNDPDGPMIYKGIYHLFYQYNPKGAVWGGNIVWAHSTSTDLVNWTPHPLAIYPSQPFDVKGCWTGSTTILSDGKPVILYTGIDGKDRQVQDLAEPKNLSDPHLVEWIKSPNNPVMNPTPENKINASSFRDPTTAWLGPDQMWRVIIGSKINRRGLAILYKSKDFVTWVEADHPLHFVEGTGMFECPDFYPVYVNSQDGADTSSYGPEFKHVLKASLDDTKHDIYTIGSYDINKDVYVSDKGSVENDAGIRYDHGKFYASKTFFDSALKRRILWGWINESSSVDDDMLKGWAGLQAIPRKIWLDKSGKQLVQWPISEIERLRVNPVKLANQTLKGGSMVKVSGVTEVQADVDVFFELASIEKAEALNPSWTNPQLICSQKGASVRGSLGPFGLLVLASKGMEEFTAVFFRVFKAQDNKYKVLMCSDQARSSLHETDDKTTYGAFLDVDPVTEKLSLRSLIDHSIVESFGGRGKACITARVYPTLAIDSGALLFAFNNGTEDVKIISLDAWSMKKAQIN